MNYFLVPVSLEIDAWPTMFKDIYGVGYKDSLPATSDMKINDIIFIHVGSQVEKYESGIYGVGKIISDPYILSDKSSINNNSLVIDYEIIKFNKTSPYVNHNDCLLYCNQYRRSNMLMFSKGYELYNRIFKINEEEVVNRKRIKSKDDWIDILKNEKQEDNVILDILFYMMNCKNYTAYGSSIYKDLKLNGIPNLDVVRFGQRIVNLKGIDNQIGRDGKNIYWNIPFETVFSKNTSERFTWKLRDELVEAISEMYDFEKKETVSTLFEDTIKDCDEKEYEESIKPLLEVQKEFVNNFNIKKIIEMSLDEFVIGKSEIDDSAYNSFCYILERKLKPLGSMLGSTASKFGVYYSTDSHDYSFTKKYGDNLEDAFKKVKEEICKLIIAGATDDFEKMKKTLLPPTFRGKILSTYYPNKYIPIFDEDDINVFLNNLDINYDPHKIDSIEKKRILLKEYKNNNKKLSKYSDYYFMHLLYRMYHDETKTKHTVSGEIDYDFEIVDFTYLGSHKTRDKSQYRSRGTDYESANRVKKDIGNRGEKAVLNYEKKTLIEGGRSDLSELVDLCDNDAIGYDIISYNLDGSEKHIEVKTSKSHSDKLVEFYFTSNEYETMIQDSSYNIYYLYNIDKKTKAHIINKKVLEKQKDEYLKPVLYKISIDVELKN